MPTFSFDSFLCHKFAIFWGGTLWIESTNKWKQYLITTITIYISNTLTYKIK
jgi:hypothetical protein